MAGFELVERATVNGMNDQTPEAFHSVLVSMRTAGIVWILVLNS